MQNCGRVRCDDENNKSRKLGRLARLGELVAFLGKRDRAILDLNFEYAGNELDRTYKFKTSDGDRRRIHRSKRAVSSVYEQVAASMRLLQRTQERLQDRRWSTMSTVFLLPTRMYIQQRLQRKETACAQQQRYQCSFSTGNAAPTYGVSTRYKCSRPARNTIASHARGPDL
jgi:hypothetical protein